MRESIAVVAIAPANRSEVSKGALSTTACDLDKAAYVLMPDGRHPFRALCDPQKS